MTPGRVSPRAHGAALVVLLVLLVAASPQAANAQADEEGGPSVTVTLVQWERWDEVAMYVRAYDYAQRFGYSGAEQLIHPVDMPNRPHVQPQLVVDQPGTYLVAVGMDAQEWGAAGTAKATVTIQYQAGPAAEPAPAVTRIGPAKLDPELCGEGKEYEVGYLFFLPDERIVTLIDSAGKTVDLTTGEVVDTPEGVTIPGVDAGAPSLTPEAEEPTETEEGTGSGAAEGTQENGTEEPESGSSPDAEPLVVDDDLSDLIWTILAVGFVFGVAGVVLVLRKLSGETPIERAARQRETYAASQRFRDEVTHLIPPGTFIKIPNPEWCQQWRAEGKTVPPEMEAPRPQGIEVHYDLSSKHVVDVWLHAQTKDGLMLSHDKKQPHTGVVYTGMRVEVDDKRLTPLGNVQFTPRHRLTKPIDVKRGHRITRYSPGRLVQVMETTQHWMIVRVDPTKTTLVPRSSVSPSPEAPPSTPPPPPPPPPGG